MSILIIMGVSGSGKSTLGQELSKLLHTSFFDADDFHPLSNREKMAKGIGLTDEDRHSWLLELSKLIEHAHQHSQSMILACSALKERYRDMLTKSPDLHFVYLKADEKLIEERLKRRQGHFVTSSLIPSQFEALEEPRDALTINAEDSTENQIQSVLTYLEGKK